MGRLGEGKGGEKRDFHSKREGFTSSFRLDLKGQGVGLVGGAGIADGQKGGQNSNCERREVGPCGGKN